MVASPEGTAEGSRAFSGLDDLGLINPTSKRLSRLGYRNKILAWKSGRTAELTCWQIEDNTPARPPRWSTLAAEYSRLKWLGSISSKSRPSYQL